MRRIYILDIFRGLSLIFVIFFHASVYNFANIHKLDFSHPPLIVVLISFLMLWGGIFIIYSTFINVNMFYMRVEKGEKKNSVKFLIVGSILYIILHFLLTLVLGRWNVDFIHNQSHMPLLAGSLREMKLIFPDISKYFEGSSISTIAINLIFVSLIINRLLKNQDKKNEIRNYLLVCLFGVFIMLISFVRIFLHPYTQIFIEQQHYLPAIIFSFFIANPYPIFPYLAYGLFGAILGVMFFKKKYSLIKRTFIPLGLFFLVYGLIGMLNFEKTISKADLFWYFKTHFELGIFLVAFTILLLMFTHHQKRPRGFLLIPYWFSRTCLTIYLFETLLSELLRKLMLQFVNSWNQTINGCLLFGGINIVLWTVILFFWQKVDFKYSLEYLWVKYFALIGKKSTKLDDI